MRKYIKWIVGGLVFGLFMTTVVTFASASDLKKETFLPSVQIEGFCSGSMIYSGREKISGKVETYVLTAKHCTEQTDEKIKINIPVYNSDLKKTSTVGYEAFVWGRSWKSDLALIKLIDEDKVFDTIASVAPITFKPDYNLPVVVVGYPLGTSMTTTFGNLGYRENVDTFSKFSTSTEFYRATPLIAPASSGSPMYAEVDGKYQVIGVLTGGFMGFQFMNYFTPLNEINEYLDQAKKAWKSNGQ